MEKMHIAGFIPQSFCDWPGRPAAVVFTPGCNFRCRYCHNAELVLHPEKFSLLDEAEIFAKLRHNRWAVDAVVITGGEPTLQPGLPGFCKRLKDLGFAVKLDTNGSRPEMLAELIKGKLVGYIAMDLKAPLYKYHEITGAGEGGIRESIRLIIDSGVDHEFRMTYAPALLAPKDVAAAVAEIRGARRFVLQQFRPKNCLDPAMLTAPQPSHEDLEKIAKSLDFSGEIRIRSDAGETVCRHQGSGRR
jgi:pyruvate formate lyase activating enzyme